jgi:hypothetical protein
MALTANEVSAYPNNGHEKRPSIVMELFLTGLVNSTIFPQRRSKRALFISLGELALPATSIIGYW